MSLNGDVLTMTAPGRRSARSPASHGKLRLAPCRDHSLSRQATAAGILARAGLTESRARSAGICHRRATGGQRGRRSRLAGGCPRTPGVPQFPAGSPRKNRGDPDGQPDNAAEASSNRRPRAPVRTIARPPGVRTASITEITGPRASGTTPGSSSRRTESACRSMSTCAPGSGKTAHLAYCSKSAGTRSSRRRRPTCSPSPTLLGQDEPWLDHDFIDQVIALQRRRQDFMRAAPDATVFFDCSPVCTLALSRYLGFAPSRLLASEVSRVVAEGTHETTVDPEPGFAQLDPPPGGSVSRIPRLRAAPRGGLPRPRASSGRGARRPLADRVALIRQTVGQLPAGQFIGLADS